MKKKDTEWVLICLFIYLFWFILAVLSLLFLLSFPSCKLSASARQTTAPLPAIVTRMPHHMLRIPDRRQRVPRICNLQGSSRQSRPVSHRSLLTTNLDCVKGLVLRALGQYKPRIPGFCRLFLPFPGFTLSCTVCERSSTQASPATTLGNSNQRQRQQTQHT